MVYVTVSTDDPGFPRLCMKELPFPPEYPVMAGEEAEAIQEKLVPAVGEEKFNWKILPEQMEAG